MIEAVIELQRNMMDVEALARESHVNPLQTEYSLKLFFFCFLEVFTEAVKQRITIVKRLAVNCWYLNWQSVSWKDFRFGSEKKINII